MAGLSNLLVPGLGIIWLGGVGTGLAFGLVFAVCANLAVWAALLVPDDLPVWGPPLAIGLAAGAYLGNQVQFMRSVRDGHRAEQRRARRAGLIAVRESLEREDYEAAWAALAPIAHMAEGDLLVAYRVAEVLTALGEAQAAWAAWERVRVLDRHHIYRDEWRTALRELLHSSDAGGNLSPGSLV